MTDGALGTALRHLRDLFDGRTVIGLTDEQLLERYAASKDGEAFEAIVVRHGPMVLATCRAILRHDPDVEDAFQATFLVLARKARTVRNGDALGGWLHRVAHRVAVQASVEAKRRRRRELKLAAMGPPVVTRPGPEVEMRSILHEEIDRLPEGQRLPVVLCDLGGMTYEQAAHQLHWTLPTLRCRLAKARKRLRSRLARHGLTPAALGFAIAPRGAPISAMWVNAAVVAATGGTGSAAVAVLTRTLIRGMLMTKLKIAMTAAIAIVALVSIGVVVVSAARSDEPRTTVGMPSLAEGPAAAAKDDLATGITPAATIEYQGRVLDPEGQPVVGARLYVATQGFQVGNKTLRPPVGRATTHDDGRFDFGIPRTDFDTTWSDERWRVAPVIAMAEGFGPALAIDRDGHRNLTLRLAKDDVTVAGHILDTDGRPVAGARIQVVVLFWPKQGDLTEWSAALKAEQSVYEVENRLLYRWDDPSVAHLFPGVETAADGRFTLQGIGRERVAGLLISGPAIETKLVRVVTRPFETSHIPGDSRDPTDRVACYGPQFDHVAGPTQVVVGTVRDKDTGIPLADVRVQGTKSLSNQARFVETTSDAEGRYRLVGLPRGRKNARQKDLVAAMAPEEKPYLPASLPLVVPPDLGTVTLDFALQRGVWVTGRVTDQATGKPTRGYVNYFVFENNPHLKEAPSFGFAAGGGRVPCDREGRFRLLALPGRGLVAARASEDRYRFGVGADRIDGLTHIGPAETFRTRPYSIITKNHHTIVEVNPPEGAESVECDIPLDPGRPFQARAIDPEGEPLPGCLVSGLADYYSRFVPVETADFDVPALGPDDTRVLLLVHVGKKLAGKAVIRPGEAGPVMVKGESWGVVTGRLVDTDGQPRGDLVMTSRGVFGKVEVEAGSLPDDLITVGKDGRFTAAGLVPGLKYTFDLWKGRKPIGSAVEEVILKAGETKALGDIKVGEG